MKLEHLFKQVRHVALKSSMKVRVGALLIKNGKVIGVGYNTLKRDFYRKGQGGYRSGKFSIHAEQACINSCNRKDLKGSTLILIKINKCGEIKEGGCCAMCSSILRKYKIVKVIIVDSV